MRNWATTRLAMAKMGLRSKIQTFFFHRGAGHALFSSSSQRIPPRIVFPILQTHLNPTFFSSSQCFLSVSSIPPSSFAASYISSRLFNTSSAEDVRIQNPERVADQVIYDPTPSEHAVETSDEVEPIDLWEEEDDAEPEIDDGGDGGGVVLKNCPWGETALSIAREVLLQFGDDMELFSFKTTPGGYVYVRLDRLSNEYGCPGIDDIESYSRLYKKRLDEVGADGDLPSDLALEVSSPGAERLLRIPDDLERFKYMAMIVSYVESDDSRSQEKNGVFFLDTIDTETGSCVWRLADVKENREPTAKGRPLSRKQRDWRLKLTYSKVRKVTLYLNC